MEPYNLRPGLIRFTNPRTKKTVGTGWIVDKEERLVLTAHHVAVKARDVDGRYHCQLLAEYQTSLKSPDDWPVYRAEMIERPGLEAHDICLLRLPDLLPEGARGYPIGRSEYSKSKIKVTGLPYHSGEIQNVSSKINSVHLDDRLFETIEVAPEQIREGFSGAPVISTRTGHLIGFCSFTRSNDQRQSTGAYLVPSATIKRLLPELPQRSAFDTKKELILSLRPLAAARLEEYVEKVATGVRPFDMYRELGSSLRLEEEPDISREEMVAIQRRTYVPLQAYGQRRTDVTVEEAIFEDGNPSDPASRTEPDNALLERGQEVAAITELLDRHPRLSLRAPAGSGKTTALQYLVLQRCHEIYPEGADDKPIPILIKAGQTANDNNVIRQLVTDQIFGDDIKNIPSHFSALMQVAPIQLCIDGLNEVPIAAYTHTMEELRRILRDFPDLKLVITSREQMFDRESLLERLESEFRVFHLRTLSNQNRQQFLYNWLVRKRAYSEEEEAQNKEEIEESAKNVLQKVERIQRHSALAATPLYLDLLAQVAMVNEKRLAQIRSEGDMFEEFFSLLFSKWPRPDGIDADQARRALALLAYHHVNAPPFRYQDIVELLTPLLGEELKVENFLRSCVSMNVLRQADLARNAVTKRRRNPISYWQFRFSHDAFRDFLAATHLDRHFITNERLPEAVSPSNEGWYQPLLLLGDLLTESPQWFWLLNQLKLDKWPHSHRVEMKRGDGGVEEHALFFAVPEHGQLLYLPEQSTLAIPLLVPPLVSEMTVRRLGNAPDDDLLAEELSRLRRITKGWKLRYFERGEEIIPLEDFFAELARFDRQEIWEEVLFDPELVSIWASGGHLRGRVSMSHLLESGNLQPMQPARWYSPEQAGRITLKRGQRSLTIQKGAALVRPRRKEEIVHATAADVGKVVVLPSPAAVQYFIREKHRSVHAVDAELRPQYITLADISSRAIRAFANNLSEPWKLYRFLAEEKYRGIEKENGNATSNFRPLKKDGKEIYSKKRASIGKNAPKSLMAVPQEFVQLKTALLQATFQRNPGQLKRIFRNYVDFEALIVYSRYDPKYFVAVLENLQQWIKKYDDQSPRLVNAEMNHALIDSKTEEASQEADDEELRKRVLRFGKAILLRHPFLSPYFSKQVTDLAPEASLSSLLGIYRSMVDAVSDELQTAINHAVDLIYLPDFAAAKVAWQQVLALAPDDKSVLSYIRQLFFQLAPDGQAARKPTLQAVLREAFDEGQAGPNTCLLLAKFLEFNKLTKECIAVYETALSAATDAEQRRTICQLLAETHLALGELTAAEKRALEGLKLTAEGYASVELLSRILQAQRRYAEASEYLETYLSRHPGDVMAIINLADCCRKAGQIERLRTWLKSAGGMVAELPALRLGLQALRQMAAIYAAVADWPDAIVMLQRALDLSRLEGSKQPVELSAARCITHLLEYLTISGDPDPALGDRLVAEAFAKDPASPEDVWQLLRYLHAHRSKEYVNGLLRDVLEHGHLPTEMALNVLNDVYVDLRGLDEMSSFLKHRLELELQVATSVLDTHQGDIALFERAVDLAGLVGTQEEIIALRERYLDELSTRTITSLEDALKLEHHVDFLEERERFAPAILLLWKDYEFRQSFPKKIGVLHRIVRLATQAGQHSDLEQALQNELELEHRLGRRRRIIDQLAFFYAQRGRPEEAVLTWLNKLDLPLPRHDKLATLGHLAELYLETGATDFFVDAKLDQILFCTTNTERVALLVAAAERLPDSPETNRARVQLLRSRLSITPKSTVALEELAIALEKSGDADEAVALFQTQLLLLPASEVNRLRPVVTDLYFRYLTTHKDRQLATLSMELNTYLYYDVAALLAAHDAATGEFSLASIRKQIAEFSGVELVAYQCAYANWSDPRLSAVEEELTQAGINTVHTTGSVPFALGLDLFESSLSSSTSILHVYVGTPSPEAMRLGQKLGRAGRRFGLSFYATPALLEYGQDHNIAIPLAGTPPVAPSKAAATKKVKSKPIADGTALLRFAVKFRPKKPAQPLTPKNRLNEFRKFFQAALQDEASESELRLGKIKMQKMKQALIQIGGEVDPSDHKTKTLKAFFQMATSGTPLGIYQVGKTPNLYIGPRISYEGAGQLLPEVGAVAGGELLRFVQSTTFETLAEQASAEDKLNGYRSVVAATLEHPGIREEYRQGVDLQTFRSALEAATALKIAYRDYMVSNLSSFLQLLLADTPVALYKVPDSPYLFVGERENYAGQGELQEDLLMPERHSDAQYRQLLQAYAQLRIPEWEIMQRIGEAICAANFTEATIDEMEAYLVAQLDDETVQDKIRPAIYAFINSKSMRGIPTDAKLTEQQFTLLPEIQRYSMFVSHAVDFIGNRLAELLGEPADVNIIRQMF